MSARVDAVRRIATVAFLVADQDEALDWFRSALGFETLSDKPLEDGKRWVVVAPGRGNQGARLLLASASEPGQSEMIGRQAGGRVFLFLETDDFMRDHAAMKARGVRFRELPRHEAYGTVAVFEDLYGNLWDLIEPATPD